MQRIRAFRHVRHVRVVLLLVVGMLAGMGVTAWASDAPGSERTLTGCVNPTLGTVSKLKTGPTPLTTCASNEYRVRLSGGDITSIFPAASGGLVGGTSNGSALLGIDYPALDTRYINAGESIAWRGTWSSSTEYVAGDAVYYSGSSFIAVAPNMNSTPVHGSTWNLLARKGAQGVPGIVGPEGAQGGQGTQGATGPQGPGLRNAVASFNGTTCAENENTVLTGVLFGTFCHIAIEAGLVDGVPIPSVWINGGAPVQWAFVPDYNGEGDSLVSLLPPGNTFYVMFTSAGPAAP